MTNGYDMKKTQEIDNPKTLHYWALFDWANSAFALVIATSLFPLYYTSITEDFISIAGNPISNTTIYAWAITSAYVIIVLITPLLSGVADVGGRRKAFLRLFTILGGLACIGLFFFDAPSRWAMGTALFILGTIGFAGGLVFYNSFLPLISSEEKMDVVSARGFAYGYFGSVLLLLFNLAMISYPESFYIKDATIATRLSFGMVGVWWIGFGLLSMHHLPKDNKRGKIHHFLGKGFQEVKIVYNELRTQKFVIRFLASFFFYSAGVQCILYLAPTFANKELGFEANELIVTVLLLQILAIGGAYLFAFLSKLKGNKFSILTMLVIWLLICLIGYGIYDKIYFFILAGAVGLVMGGIQSLSRSTYAKFVTKGKQEITTYFSLFDILEKLSVISGTFIFGLVEQITGGMRNSLLSLAIFFLIGIVFLAFTKVKPIDIDKNIISKV